MPTPRPGLAMTDHTPAPIVATYGTWTSALDAARVAAGAHALAAPRIAPNGRVRWLQSVPAEGGRVVVVELAEDGGRKCLTPPGFNVRSRVHEYGGGACAMHGEAIWFSNYADHLIYEQVGDAAPRALTHHSTQRHADLLPDPARRRLIAVREDHGSGATEAVNTLVALSLEPSGESVVLDAGADFYAAPCLSPEGRRLAWLRWSHPLMPWNGCELWLAAIDRDGALANPRRVAGGADESLVQPQWGPDGHLYVASDRSGYWNLYRVDASGLVPLWPTTAEFARPAWTFGQCTFGFVGRDEILAVGIHDGRSRLWRIDTSARVPPREVPTPFDDLSELRVAGDRVVALAGSATLPESVVEFGADGQALHVLARSVEDLPDPADIAQPRSVYFAGAQGRPTHAWHYAPCNARYRGPADAAPPLIVTLHGGPTGMTTSSLRSAVQFWTTRGFALLDIDYGGSSGFGRDYRARLSGQWGVVDVADCIAGARWLAAQGLADPSRMAIRGGSAGGFTVLAALVEGGTFRAGACYYGVADLRALDADTHKFESRYSTDLLGPPQVRERLYLERSPLHHADRIDCPVIFFQGLDDRVVPPAQSESMVAALAARGIPVAYQTFDGEGHGFRRRESIERALRLELAFYASVFGFALPDAPVALPWV